MQRLLLTAPVVLFSLGCFGLGYAGNHAIQWNSAEQIYASDATQVQVRNAQSRTIDTNDKRGTLEAVVATFQDLDFQVEVLDPELGIVSGKKFIPRRAPDTSYFTYDAESLVLFSKSYRTWGPFYHRSDLVRLTVTVREANAKQLIVRAAAQYYLEPLEGAEPYQKFFQTFEKARFVARETGR